MTNQEYNIALVEHFGRLERLCNDMYGTHHGVTEYMEELKTYYGPYHTTYQTLPELRHKRNQLSHGNVSFNEPFANKDDVGFLIAFRDDILQGKDPLTIRRRNMSQKPVRQYTQGLPTKKADTSHMYWIALLIIAAVVLVGTLFVYTMMK